MSFYLKGEIGRPCIHNGPKEAQRGAQLAYKDRKQMAAERKDRDVTEMR